MFVASGELELFPSLEALKVPDSLFDAPHVTLALEALQFLQLNILLPPLRRVPGRRLPQNLGI